MHLHLPLSWQNKTSKETREKNIEINFKPTIKQQTSKNAHCILKYRRKVFMSCRSCRCVLLVHFMCIHSIESTSVISLKICWCLRLIRDHFHLNRIGFFFHRIRMMHDNHVSWDSRNAIFFTTSPPQRSLLPSFDRKVIIYFSSEKEEHKKNDIEMNLISFHHFRVNIKLPASGKYPSPATKPRNISEAQFAKRNWKLDLEKQARIIWMVLNETEWNLCRRDSKSFCRLLQSSIILKRWKLLKF